MNNLVWTVSSEKQLLHLVLSSFLHKPFKVWRSVFLLISSTYCTPFWKISLADFRMHTFLSKGGADDKSAIFSIKGSRETTTEANYASFALILREASDGIWRTLRWCSTTTEVALVGPNQDLTHLVASAFAFLMNAELIFFPIIWKYKESIK